MKLFLLIFSAYCKQYCVLKNMWKKTSFIADYCSSLNLQSTNTNLPLHSSQLLGNRGVESVTDKESANHMDNKWMTATLKSSKWILKVFMTFNSCLILTCNLFKEWIKLSTPHIAWMCSQWNHKHLYEIERYESNAIQSSSYTMSTW